MRGDIHPEGKEKASTLCLHLTHRSSSELWTATTAGGEGEGGGVGGGEPNGGP